MRNLNVCVWGLGAHALRRIIPALMAHPKLKLYGVCSRNSETVAGISQQSNCQGWTEPASMLQDPQVDVVYLSTPIALHAQQGREILKAGKHLWCEKPLTMSETETAELVNLSRQKGLVLAEGFMYLYHSQFSFVRETLSRRALGSIQSISCRFGIPKLERASFRNDPKLGGGAFWDIGCYPVSAVLALFPDVTPQVLFSQIISRPGQSVDYKGQAVLQLNSELRANLEWGSECAYRNEIDLWGEEGSLFVDRFFSKTSDYIPKFRFLDRNGSESYQSGQAEDHFIAMFNAFHGYVFNSIDAEKERIVISRRAALMDKIKGRVHAAHEQC